MESTLSHDRPLCSPWFYNFALQTFVKGVVYAAGGLIIEGGENFVTDSNTILASAHRHGIVDVCALAQTVEKLTDNQKKIYFMSKKENFEHRIVGKALRGVGIFDIDRESMTPIWEQYDVLSHTRKINDQGGILGIFAEGTRRTGDRINKKDIKIGAAALALYFGGNIIPAGLGGTENPRLKGLLSVVLEEPIHVSQIPDEDIQAMGVRDFVHACKPIRQELYEKLNEAQFRAAQLVKA